MAPITAESSTGFPELDQAPLAVREFVMRQGLGPDLRDAVRVASEVFEVSGPITLSMEEDPDTGEVWVEMNVAARGSVEEVMTAHERFTERQLSFSTPSVRQVRLFLHIARD